METYKIKVIFRKYKEGDIIALFPYEPEFNYKIGCYQHIGQHGIADYDHVLEQTKLATFEEYKDLKKELEVCFEYEIETIKRVNRAKMIEQWRSLHKIYIS